MKEEEKKIIADYRNHKGKVLLNLLPQSLGGNVVSHPAGPGSIPDRVSFLVEIVPKIFLNCNTASKFRPRISQDHHLSFVLIRLWHGCAKVAHCVPAR